MPKESMINLARLEELMQAKNWGLGELATYSGVKYDTLYSLKVGRRPNAGITNVKKIADALGTTVDDLMKKEGDGAPNKPQMPESIKRLAERAARLSELRIEELVQIAAILEKMEQEQAENPIPVAAMPVFLEMLTLLKQRGDYEQILPILEALLPGAARHLLLNLGEDVPNQPGEDSGEV